MLKSNLVTSAKGLQFISLWEGFSPRPYKDQAGLWTIGYGHLLLPSEKSGKEWERMQQGISEAEALGILHEDCVKAETSVNNVGVGYTQWQFDALVAFVFNVGVGNFNASTMKKKLIAAVNAHNYNFPALLPTDIHTVAREFQKWCKITVRGQKVTSAGLVRRRKSEEKLFVDGEYKGNV